MDWRAYHAVNVFVSHHTWLGSVFRGIETASIPVFVVATVALWLLARPGGSPKWKLAAVSGLASAGVALIANRIIASIWHRDRPFQAHRVAHVWGARKTDASFPSDHASATFAIAFAVFFYDRVAGSLFLAGAVLVAGGRVVVGEHYPGDVLAGLCVGLGAAILCARLARPLLLWLVRLVARLTDPLLAPAWRLRSRA
jgi:membrane-associated phospholipid phosphatase